MNMWRETGPGGMMKELEKAGLSEALIYKQGASGGQTAASVPNAPQATFQRGSAAGNVWAAGVQAAVADSAIEANKAQANKANAEADSIRGVAGTTGEAQISSLTQGIEESKARQALTEIQTQIGKTEAYIKTASAEDAIDRIKYDTQNALNKARSSMVEANIDEATQATKIDTIKQENTKIYLEQELLKATTDKTEATTQNIKQATQQIIQQMVEYKGTGAREDLKVFNEGVKIKLDAILKAQGLEIYDQSVKNQLFGTAIGLMKMTPH